MYATLLLAFLFLLHTFAYVYNMQKRLIFTTPVLSKQTFINKEGNTLVVTPIRTLVKACTETMPPNGLLF